jgi:hypothetical protein
MQIPDKVGRPATATGKAKMSGLRGNPTSMRRLKGLPILTSLPSFSLTLAALSTWLGIIVVLAFCADAIQALYERHVRGAVHYLALALTAAMVWMVAIAAIVSCTRGILALCRRLKATVEKDK